METATRSMLPTQMTIMARNQLLLSSLTINKQRFVSCVAQDSHSAQLFYKSSQTVQLDCNSGFCCGTPWCVVSKGGNVNISWTLHHHKKDFEIDCCRCNKTLIYTNENVYLTSISCHIIVKIVDISFILCFTSTFKAQKNENSITSQKYLKTIKFYKQVLFQSLGSTVLQGTYLEKDKLI